MQSRKNRVESDWIEVTITRITPEKSVVNANQHIEKMENCDLHNKCTLGRLNKWECVVQHLMCLTLWSRSRFFLFAFVFHFFPRFSFMLRSFVVYFFFAMNEYSKHSRTPTWRESGEKESFFTHKYTQFYIIIFHPCIFCLLLLCVFFYRSIRIR